MAKLLFKFLLTFVPCESIFYWLIIKQCPLKGLVDIVRLMIVKVFAFWLLIAIMCPRFEIFIFHSSTSKFGSYNANSNKLSTDKVIKMYEKMQSVTNLRVHQCLPQSLLLFWKHFSVFFVLILSSKTLHREVSPKDSYSKPKLNRLIVGNLNNFFISIWGWEEMSM